MAHRVIHICVFLVLLASCGCTKKSNEINGISDYSHDNVVVILIDTLRADHLPFYQYTKNTAPFLNELAQQSVLFENAIPASSTTAPSAASLFTSLYPSQHGVITGFVAHKKLLEAGGGQITLNRIPERLPTIGKEFKEAGYKTYCVADNPNISHVMGYDQGFDKFEDFRYKGATVVNDTLKGWAPEMQKGGRYFLYLHYMDPHEPYHKQKPWYQDSPDSRQRTINAYDSEISYADQHIREMFDLFGWKDNAFVVFVADHGEEFWDHGERGHGKTLYREVTRVPFLIYHRSLVPRRIAAQVQLLDVLPTLAEMLQLQKSDNWMGQSLVPFLRGEQMRDRFVFLELLRSPERPRPSRRSAFPAVEADRNHHACRRTKHGAVRRAGRRARAPQRP